MKSVLKQEGSSRQEMRTGHCWSTNMQVTPGEEVTWAGCGTSGISSIQIVSKTTTNSAFQHLEEGTAVTARDWRGTTHKLRQGGARKTSWGEISSSPPPELGYQAQVRWKKERWVWEKLTWKVGSWWSFKFGPSVFGYQDYVKHSLKVY